MGEFNIDVKRKGVDSNHLSDFRDLFHLTDIVKFTTCFTKTHISLTNRHLLIKCLLVSETGLSEYHRMITTFFKLDFSRLRSKVITYRSYKKFHEEKFLNDLKETNIIIDPNQNYKSLTRAFLTFVNKRVPLKREFYLEIRPPL